MQTQSNDIRVSNEKQLRLGIFSRRTETLEEKLIPIKGTVTIGKTPDCTIALPYAEIDASFILFEPLPEGRYALYFTETTTGSIKTRNKEQTLRSCIEQKLSTKQGTRYSVSLPHSAQGRIELPDVVVLFSFVPVKQRATPIVPAELKPEFFSSLDRPFLAFLGLSFLLHAGVAYMAQTRIVPQQEPLFLEETLAGLMIQQPAAEPPPVNEPEEKSATNEPNKAKEESKAAPSPALTQKPRTIAAPSDEPQDGRVGLVAVLGRESADGGVFAQLFNQSDALSAIDGVKPQAVQTARDGDEIGAQLKKGQQEGTGELLGLNEKDLKPNVQTAPQDPSTKKERPVNVKVLPPTGPLCEDCGPTNPPNPGDILRPYQRRIQACYERELPNNENLAGKLTAEFTLSTAGRVLSINFSTDTLQSEAVSSCVSGVLRSIKFPELDSEVKFSVSFIFDKQ